MIYFIFKIRSFGQSIIKSIEGNKTKQSSKEDEESFPIKDRNDGFYGSI